MGAEPAVFGAYYRRFEDEVLGWFLARGAKPEVAADLTAETFAAALSSRRWNRLAHHAQRTLEVSRREGRVVADARQRRGMPPLPLTESSVARIAAIDTNAFALGHELQDEDDDVRVRVIDERDIDPRTAELRLSDAVMRAPRAELNPDRRATPRIPELEEALAAIAPAVSSRRRASLIAAAVVVVVVLAFVVASVNDHDHPVPTLPPGSGEAGEIARIGNGWAGSFAAAGPESCVLDMSESACNRLTCENGDPLIKECTPFPVAIRRSFRGATVQGVLVRGRLASARFSNGIVVEFGRAAPDSPWQVEAVGTSPAPGLIARELSLKAKVRRVGNDWARLYSSSDQPRCNPYMTQLACERTTCERISGPIKKCVVPTIGFRHSFHDATVRKLVVAGRRAAATFSNGEVVELAQAQDAAAIWLVHKIGPGAGRGLHREERLVLTGNAWARFFAATTRHCVEYMTPQACEQAVSARFKRSFKDATIDEVVAVKGPRAVARFSNGQLVEFRYVADGGGTWSVAKLGRHAGRGLLPE